MQHSGAGPAVPGPAGLGWRGKLLLGQEGRKCAAWRDVCALLRRR